MRRINDDTTAVGTDGVDWIRQRPFFADQDVKYMADEPVALPVVPDNVTFRTGQPLQHAAIHGGSA